MIFLFSALAFAEPPTTCDPARDTAPEELGGFCLDEDGYAEIGLLRKRVETLEVEKASLESEVVSFEEWRVRHDAILTYTVDSMKAAHETGIDLVVETCREDLGEANERTKQNQPFLMR